jgi:hypothetical protein
MNDDSMPQSPARQSQPEDHIIPNQPTGRGDGETLDDGKSEASQRLQRRVRRGLTKKLRLMTQLLKNLDTLVYAELSALYYLECV